MSNSKSASRKNKVCIRKRIFILVHQQYVIDTVVDLKASQKNEDPFRGEMLAVFHKVNVQKNPSCEDFSSPHPLQNCHAGLEMGGASPFLAEIGR